MDEKLNTLLVRAITTYLTKEHLSSYPPSILEMAKPNHPEHGDVASAAPLQLAKLLKRPPLEIARELALSFQEAFRSLPNDLANDLADRKSVV